MELKRKLRFFFNIIAISISCRKLVYLNESLIYNCVLLFEENKFKILLKDHLMFENFFKELKFWTSMCNTKN